MLNNAMKSFLICCKKCDDKCKALQHVLLVSHDCGIAVTWLLSQIIFGFYVFIKAYQALCALLCQNGPLMFPDVISVPLRNAFSY